MHEDWTFRCRALCPGRETIPILEAIDTQSNKSLAAKCNSPDEEKEGKNGRNVAYSDSRDSVVDSFEGFARLSPIEAPRIPATTSRLCRGVRISISNVSAASFTAMTPSTRPTA